MDFSIIIPAKNEEANIGRCLDSINRLLWDKSRYEVIVVDNGSVDRTAEIAREKGAIVHVKPGITISGLRNFGASRASGDILAFIDADCTVDKRWLNEAARYLSREDVVCFGSPPIPPEKATWVQKTWFAVRERISEVGEADWLESMNMFVRRDAFARCGGFDEKLVTCEDYDLSVRLRKIGLLLNDSRLVVVHHGEAATVAHFFRKELWRGAGNLRGLARHGFVLRELPSLITPSLHCLLIASVGIGLPFYSTGAYKAVIGVFVLWQLLVLIMASWKSRTANPARVFRLYALLNVYLAARGVAVFRRTVVS